MLVGSPTSSKIFVFGPDGLALVMQVPVEIFKRQAGIDMKVVSGLTFVSPAITDQVSIERDGVFCRSMAIAPTRVSQSADHTQGVRFVSQWHPSGGDLSPPEMAFHRTTEPLNH